LWPSRVRAEKISRSFEHPARDFHYADGRIETHGDRVKSHERRRKHPQAFLLHAGFLNFLLEMCFGMTRLIAAKLSRNTMLLMVFISFRFLPITANEK